MNKSKQGVSLREIARRWRVAPSYVHKFLLRAGLGPLSDGSYDFNEATRHRETYTLAGWGQRTWLRHNRSDDVTECKQCGALYIPSKAWKEGNRPKNGRLYCSEECEQDEANGLTVQQTIAKLKRWHLDSGGSRRDLKNPDKWLNYTNHYRAN